MPRMSTTNGARGTPEQPRFEPEIIPPDHTTGGAFRNERAGDAANENVFVFIDERGGMRRIHVGRPSPFSILLAFLVGGAVLAGLLLLTFSVVVVLLPIIAIAAAALIG